MIYHLLIALEKIYQKAIERKNELYKKCLQSQNITKKILCRY